MIHRFGEIVPAISLRATSAVLFEVVVGNTIFLSGERPDLAGPCHRDSTAEHPLCATSQTVALVLASVSDGVGGQ